MESIIFKSKQTIEDTSVLKTGEIRFIVDKELCSITTNYAKTLSIKIVNGTGNFTDSEGNVIGIELPEASHHTFYATKGSIVSIPDKYALYSIVCSSDSRLTIDFDDLKYSSSITSFKIYGNPIGDVSALKRASSITSIEVTGANFFGNLNVFTNATSLVISSPSDKVTLDMSNLPSSLTRITFNNAALGVYGNIEDAVNVTDFWLKPCPVTGSIANLNVGLTRLGIVGCNLITGTFADIANYSSLTQVDMSGTLINGNLGDVPINTCPNLSILRLPDGVTYTQAQKDAFLNAHSNLSKIEGGTLIENAS